MKPLRIILLLFFIWNCSIAETKETSSLPKSLSSPTSSSVIPHKKTTPLHVLLPKRFNKAQIKLAIYKSKYQLKVFYKNKAIKTYPVVFGPDPINDKRREGDGRTPEGLFKIKALYSHPHWSKFLWINYPTSDSWKKHRLSKQRGDIPANSTIGGEIGIHGVPGNQDDLISEKQNWTAGCISLNNHDIQEIYQVSRIGTLVEIYH